MLDDKNTGFNNLESAMEALKAMMNNVEPKLVEPNIFNSMLQMAPVIVQKQQQITKSNLNKALASLEDAREDIKVSKLIFGAKIYSRSVYSLQQSVEKACKALGLALGFIKNQKSIKHISPNVFIKMLEDQFSMNFLLPFLEQYTQENQVIKIEKAKEAISKKKSDLLRIKEDSLNAFLTLIESMKGQGQGSQKAILELNRIQESLNTFLPQFKMDIDVESIVDLMFCTTALYVLAVITFPHWEGSHYSDTNDIKPKDYTKDMPLVKNLSRMQGLTESAIESLDRYIKHLIHKK